MLKKKKAVPVVEKRKVDRRKPGDRRFPGRLVGLRKGVSRVGDRRSASRRRK